MDGGGHTTPPLCTVISCPKAFEISVWVTLERNLPLRE